MLSSNSSSCNQNPNYSLFSENDITSFPFPNSPHFEYDDVYLQFLEHFDLDSVTPDWNDAKIHNNNNNNNNYQPYSADDGISGGNPSSGAAAAEHHQQYRRPSAAGRTMKKDRHSKINTARGPRDRRMRLSLDIARKFFDLQDLLRFDKASRTVDWLLRHSAAAIRDLVRGRDGGVLDRCSLTLTESNCTSEECCGEAATSSSAATEVKTTAAESRSGRRGKRGIKQQKRARVGKESRNKARDRARERTSQKKRLMREKNSSNGTVVDAAGTTTTAAAAQNFPLIYDAAAAQGLLCQFNFHQTTNQFFNQGEQIADTNMQFNDKTWEAYNSFNLSE